MIKANFSKWTRWNDGELPKVNNKKNAPKLKAKELKSAKSVIK